jgi:hypothetical protein
MLGAHRHYSGPVSNRTDVDTAPPAYDDKKSQPSPEIA